MTHSPNLYLIDKSFSELLAMFMIDIANDSEYYDNLAFYLMQNHAQLTLGLLSDFSSIRKRAIISTLGWARHDIDFNAQQIDIEQTLLPLLNHDDPWVIFEAISALKYIDSDHFDKIKPFLTHDDVYIRSASIQYFSKRQGLIYKNAVIDYLKDPHPLIRETALDELDEMDGLPDDELIAIISPYLTDENKTVRELVQYIINSRN